METTEFIQQCHAVWQWWRNKSLDNVTGIGRLRKGRLKMFEAGSELAPTLLAVTSKFMYGAVTDAEPGILLNEALPQVIAL
jgi:hypothetical protein